MLRTTSGRAPLTPSVQVASGLPFGALISPLAPSPPPPTLPPVDSATAESFAAAVSPDASAIPRCDACAAYISALAELTPNSWTCPMCLSRNTLPQRYDAAVRAGPDALALIPELSRTVYDVIVPDDAPLTPASYIFVVDATGDAAYLDAMRLAVRHALDVVDGPTFVGLMIFNESISLVDARGDGALRRFDPLDADLSVHTVFPPHQWLRPSGLPLTDALMRVLADLSPVHEGSSRPSRPFGAAAQTALDMVETAGLTATRIIAILAGEPDAIEGSVPAPEVSARPDALPAPRTTFYSEQGARAAACSAMIDIYLACRAPPDVASLAPLAHLSGGRLHLYETADDALHRDVWQHLNDPAVLRGMLRLRATPPLMAAEAYGSGVWRDDGVRDVFRLSCHGHSATLAVDLGFAPAGGPLPTDPTSPPVVQAAFRGVFLEPGALPHRVLRVETRALLPDAKPSALRTSADARAAVALVFHRAVAAADEIGIGHARVQLFDWLAELVARARHDKEDVLPDAENALPGCDALLDAPRLVFGLVRSPLFRQGGVAADARVALRAVWEDLSADLLAAAAYPHLESYVDLDTPGKSGLALSSMAVRECGDPILMVDAFSEVVIYYAMPDRTDLTFPPPEGCALMRARAARVRDRPVSPRFVICREGTPKDRWFKSYLIEDAVAGAAAQSFSSFMQGVVDTANDVGKDMGKDMGKEVKP